MKAPILFLLALAACGDRETTTEPPSSPVPEPSFIPPVALVEAARVDAQAFFQDATVLAAATDAPNGVRLPTVTPGDTLDRLGLRPGDLLTAIGGDIVPNLATLRQVMTREAPSLATRSEIILFVNRGGDGISVLWKLHGPPRAP